MPIAGAVCTCGFDSTWAARANPGRRVMAGFTGDYLELPLNGFGVADPQPAAGGPLDFSAHDRRYDMIAAIGGIPVMSLMGCPRWMQPEGAGPFDPPDPTHNADFAALCQAIADHFAGRITHFIVWNELEGFFDAGTDSWDAARYTAMYNAVYTAIKADGHRPDALVGGPYASILSNSTSLSINNADAGLGLNPPAKNGDPAVGGQWGFCDQRLLDAITTWISTYAGADFLCVDATSPPGTDPVTSSVKYYDISRWLTAQMDDGGRGVLPIWWLESHRDPTTSPWTDTKTVAARVATLMLMSARAVTVGMRWQRLPGQPELRPGSPSVLSVLKAPLALDTGQPPGVVVGWNSGGTLLVNTTTSPLTAKDGTTLAAGQVLAR